MTDWAELAACKEADTALFFPVGAGRATYVEARKLCGRCSVRQSCLEDVLAFEGRYAVRSGKAANLRHGMFGGTTPDQRQKMHWLWKLRRVDA